MPDGNRNILDNVTPTSTLPRRTPGASGHRPVGPRPTLPRQTLTARPLPHDLADQGWPHIPTSRPAAGSYTRASLDAAIKADASDNDRVIPRFPSPRRSPEQKPAPVPGQRSGAYDAIVLGQPHAWSAF